MGSNGCGVEEAIATGAQQKAVTAPPQCCLPAKTHAERKTGLCNVGELVDSKIHEALLGSLKAMLVSSKIRPVVTFATKKVCNAALLSLLYGATDANESDALAAGLQPQAGQNGCRKV
ncbi:MAG: hypothetical protein FRX49_06106 [Trebouxia sp. A1-2]|nr:MAG: hypothetical protein FRX49_06106 [Trebouxia sp. A1-2]